MDIANIRRRSIRTHLMAAYIAGFIAAREGVVTDDGKVSTADQLGPMLEFELFGALAPFPMSHAATRETDDQALWRALNGRDGAQLERLVALGLALTLDRRCMVCGLPLQAHDQGNAGHEYADVDCEVPA